MDMEKRLTGLLLLALRYSASDIHFMIRGNDIVIELRVAETLLKVKTKREDLKLVRFLQYKADLDVGNLQQPQTGRFEMQAGGHLLSLRFAVITTLNGTSAVLRILNSGLKIDPAKISTIHEQNVFFEKLLKLPHGLVLFSGPTGSGKTTTLYTLISAVAAKNKVYTIEDPIEVYNDNLVQLQVNEAAGLDYSEGIRQILRHDPDIIMIGEIRDDKAAKMAVIAANTGHLVLATIHCGKASNCISRMSELGVSEQYLYEVLLCIVNQRMAHRADGSKNVLYEIMDADEIMHYRKNGVNSSSFVSIDEQFARGVRDGVYHEE